MSNFRYSFDQIKIARYLIYWTLLIVPLAFIVGSLVALFLYLLEVVTQLRWHNLWLIYLLPLAGVLIFFLYKTSGKNSDAGNNVVLDEIHEPGGGVPARMTPLILFTTIVTHLFGGSAGREGTAVQMGGSLASLLATWYKLHKKEQRILLMCGMAAGFGAVFGTPVAGAIFAMEVLAIGRIKYNALVPCLMAALLADITCSVYGIHHTKYTIAFTTATDQWLPYFSFNLYLLFKVVLAGIAFGLVSYFFAESMHFIKLNVGRHVRNKWLVPIVGGIAVVGITYAIGSYDYLGLGVSNPFGGVSIISAFQPGGTTPLSWLWKLLLTVITLTTGFKGGEVTPLFFIGATLGNILASVSGSPVDLFAGLGFIAVFAGATNTPIACTLMGAELFGSNNIIYYAVACFTAYYFSGHSGIYTSQKLAVSKFHTTRATQKAAKNNDQKDPYDQMNEAD